MRLYKQKASGYTEEVGEGFNGWAFLFGPLWYLFKGMIGRAILVFFGVLILSLVLSWFGAIIGWIVMGATANRSYEDYLIKKGYSIVNKREKEEELEEDELKWECDFCSKKFKTKKEAEEHEKRCKSKAK
jgi:multidrug efflux pump subunit AcrB